MMGHYPNCTMSCYWHGLSQGTRDHREEVAQHDPQSESQCGFRHGRGCADQLFSLRMLMEKAREYHQPIYACFIDLKKAYDSVHRESLWRILQHSYCLPPKLLSIMRALHEDSTAAVRAYGKLSDKFSVTSGVRQGCVLAPTLFNFYFDVAIRMALEEHRQQGSGIRVAYLLDADLVGNASD